MFRVVTCLRRLAPRPALRRFRRGSGYAQAPAGPQGPARRDPPSVISNPPRDFSEPVTYPDPDIITIDPSFNALRVGNTPIQRLWTGGMWCEGPAWNGQGQYLIWSDIPNNRQLRWLQDDGQVTVFRQPSGHSNGNTFDHQGRQLSCEHSGRRVVRYEHDGSITVIADSYQGKRLNSPNDIACHIDGSYWFSDPPYGGQIYEGMPDAPGGPSNKQGALNAKVGQPAGSGVLKRELSNNIYRVDPSGRIDMVISEEAFGGIPNGVCFSPDYKRLYVCSRGSVFTLRCRCRRPGEQPAAVRRFHGRYRALRHRRHPHGCVWKSLGQQQRRPERRLQRRDGMEPRRQTHRSHPAAGSLREHLLRRPETQPALHGRGTIALRGVHEHAGIFARVVSPQRHRGTESNSSL